MEGARPQGQGDTHEAGKGERKALSHPLTPQPCLLPTQSCSGVPKLRNPLPHIPSGVSLLSCSQLCRTVVYYTPQPHASPFMVASALVVVVVGGYIPSPQEELGSLGRGVGSRGQVLSGTNVL